MGWYLGAHHSCYVEVSDGLHVYGTRLQSGHMSQIEMLFNLSGSGMINFHGPSCDFPMGCYSLTYIFVRALGEKVQLTS